mgnify:FL=1
MLQRIKRKLRFACSRHRRDNKGFTLIEVIAVTIILGVMATMLLPSIDGAGAKARNAKLKNDLATLDQAIASYKLEQGSVPESLDKLVPAHIARNKGFKDAKNKDLAYTANDPTYTLSGTDTEGNTITSDGSAVTGTGG